MRLSAISVVALVGAACIGHTSAITCDAYLARTNNVPSGPEFARALILSDKLRDAWLSPYWLLGPDYTLPPITQNLTEDTFVVNFYRMEEGHKPINQRYVLIGPDDCEDTFRKIISQCIEPGNYWGGWENQPLWAYTVANLADTTFHLPAARTTSSGLSSTTSQFFSHSITSQSVGPSILPTVQSYIFP